MRLKDRLYIGGLALAIGLTSQPVTKPQDLSDLLKPVSVHAEESAKSNKKYSYNDFKGIEEVIPNGSYNVQVFSPPEGVEKDFLYIITPLNGLKADIQEPHYVSDLGVKTMQQLADLIKQKYGNSLKPFELMTDTIEHKKALVGYSIGKRNSIEVADVRPNKAVRPNRAKRFSIYLRAPGSYQGAGGGSGGGGAGGAGGAGASSGGD